MTVQEIIVVLNAYLIGEKIEVKLTDRHGWAEIIAEPRWDFEKFTFRIAPKLIHPMLTAFDEGKVVEWYLAGCDEWTSCLSRNSVEISIRSNHKLRIKPSKRLIRVEELPMPCFYRDASDAGKRITTVLAKGPEGLAYWASGVMSGLWEIRWSDIQFCVAQGGEWSPDGKTWHSFEREASE